MADDENTIDEETKASSEEPEAASPEAAAEPEAAEEAAPVEEPAAEPEAAEEAAPVEEPAAEPEAAEEAAPVEEPAAEPEAAEEPAAEPEAPAKPRRSGRHVPRSARRTRTKPKREPSAERKPLTRTEKTEHERGRRQERRGVVVSDKADKTIVVKVDVIKSHPKYKKVVRRSVKFHAHDETNSAGIGDTVRIVETRPLSKQKRWRLAEIVEKAR
jgi:small subunit ribosomal protein S17